MRKPDTVSVYIVEDSLPVLQALKALIADIDGAVAVGSSETVDGALKGIERSQPDLVIVDVRLKKESGLDLLERLKKADPIKPIVAILSADASPEQRARALSLGADYFLDKSFEFDRIALITRTIADRTAIPVKEK